MTHRSKWALPVAILMVTVSAIGLVHGLRPQAGCRGSVPTRIDGPALSGLFDTLARDSSRDLKAVVVARRGCIEDERYFNGDGPRTLHDIRSATKSITALLVGQAIQQRLIPGVDEPIGRLLPASLPPAMGSIRLRDLLTMRSGLDSDDRDSLAAGNENRLDASCDWLAFAASVPMKRAPGERYVYSSLNAYLAGAVVEQASHLPLAVFAKRRLFDPLGIKRYQWRRGPRGEGAGQGNLSITARDMVAIGEMMLHDGRFQGRQVVDSAWVAAALEPRVSIADADRYADWYGYLWYRRRYDIGGRSVTVEFASGNGGNKIYLVPQLDMVVAITSSAYGQGYGQRRSERILLRILETELSWWQG